MFDNETTMTLTAQIFGLSTMISSYQIYNVQNRIQEDNLQVSLLIELNEYYYICNFNTNLNLIPHPHTPLLLLALGSVFRVREISFVPCSV